jgi:uncharacterized protein DUF3489
MAVREDAQKRKIMTNPETTPEKKKRAAPQGASKRRKAARAAKRKPQAKATKAASTPTQSKGATILEMIGWPNGASLAEIQKAVGWQAHSVRGFLSTAAKKHNVHIESFKNDIGDRVYRSAS